MTAPKLTKLEFQIMEALWVSGELAVRDILESLPGERRPAYTTIQTTVYRMEAKELVRRVKKVGNVNVFTAVISRDAAEHRLIDELLAVLGGRSAPVMAHLVESGKVSLAEFKQAEEALRKLSKRRN